MIQFFIKKIELVLPDDFSTTIIDENPLITNKGEFSLDIDTSLLDKANARAFNFVQRLNNSTVDKDGDCVMISDGRVRNGKFTVLSNTDISVKWQFIAGNSELNYIAQNDTKIFTLPWGTESAIDYDRALLSISLPGYSANNPFVCTPVLTKDKDGNDLVLNNYKVSTQTSETLFAINGVENIVMQPYLMYYIKKLPELLGYTLKTNILDNDTRANKIYLTNTVQSLEYNYALPDMTISEFLNEICTIFNVEFKVNSALKTIDIVRVSEAIKAAPVVKLTDVLDAYERSEEDKKETSKLSFNKLSYDLDGSTYFRYQQFSKEVMDKMYIQNHPNFAAMVAYLDSIGLPYDIFRIYRDTEKENDWIGISNTQLHPSIIFYTYPITRDGDFDYLKLLQNVNKLSAYVTGDGQSELILKIAPAEVVKQSITVNYNYGSGTGQFAVYFQAPKSKKAAFIPSVIGLKAMVETSEPEAERLSTIEIGMFAGRITLYYDQDASTVTTTYPFSNIDDLPEFGPTFISKTNCLKSKAWAEAHFTPAITSNLKLKGPGGIYDSYFSGEVIDYSKKYKFIMPDSPLLQVGNIFEFESQKYITIRFEREKSNKKSLVVGYFYRMLD